MTAPSRAALRVLWGPASRTRHVLAPGASLVVGRDEDCDVALSHDPALSGRHFAIAWDGASGTVRDLDSRTGTELGGVRAVGPTPVRHRSWIRAGSTDLTFEIEMAPPRIDPSRRAIRDSLAAIAAAGRLWAIVDASRGDRVLSLLRSSMDDGRSLYEGLQGDVLEEVAPHLVHFEPGSRLLDALVSEGWSSGWALYVESDRDERSLRRHFRRFLIVEAEGLGPRTYFRYYDPAVFGSFWDMATSRQRAELSREVDAFWVPDADGKAHRIAGAARAIEGDS